MGGTLRSVSHLRVVLYVIAFVGGEGRRRGRPTVVDRVVRNEQKSGLQKSRVASETQGRSEPKIGGKQKRESPLLCYHTGDMTNLLVRYISMA